VNPIQTLCGGAIFVGFGVLEIASGRFKNLGAAKDDWKLESAMVVILLILLQPSIFILVNWLCSQYIPASRNALATLPAWEMFAVLLVTDDLTQYWWHRASHSPLLWPLHRAHHSAAYMSVRFVYRNNSFYYAMMPGLWISSVLFYLGFGNVYVVYFVLKMLVIISAHSALRWDAPLYKIRILHPLMWVLERTVSTPATHYAHHAITMEDGIGHYKGNYGNFLFLWDVLFGTALITRQYPAVVGLQDDIVHGKENWVAELMYPVVKSQRSHSALGKECVIVE